jgi:hypothetical protein
MVKPTHDTRITTAVRRIAPELAAAMLANMTGNRTVRQGPVRRFARDMQAGRWLLNGEPIIVDDAGQVLDGQHRLHAVVMAGVAVDMLVVSGVPASAMPTIDTGSARTYRDVLTIRGGADHNPTVASTARLYWRHEKGMIGTRGSRQEQASHQDLDDILRRHPQIEASVRYVRSLRVVSRRCVPSVQAFVHAWLTENADGEIADLFLRELDSGAGLDETNAVYRLRRRLVDGPSAGRMHQDDVLGLTIKAYNAWLAGVPLQQLTLRADEKFPELGKLSRDALRAHERKGNVEPGKTVELTARGATRSGRKGPTKRRSA